MVRASASGKKVLDGDWRAAWDRVLAALATAPGFAVDEQSPAEGIIRASTKKLLGRVDVTLRFTELETGEIEIRLDATPSGIVDAAAALSVVERALPPR